MGFGLFGKLPQKRDFVSIGLPHTVLHPFETWLQQAVAASRSEIGRGWEDYYLVAPIWRFWLGPELFGSVCAGALMASVDQVGRYFPLSIIYVADPKETLQPPLLAPLEDWYRAIEQRLLAVLSEDDRADIGNILAGLPTPREVEQSRPVRPAAPVVPPAPPPPVAAPVPPPSPVAAPAQPEARTSPPEPPAQPHIAVLGGTPPASPAAVAVATAATVAAEPGPAGGAAANAEEAVPEAVPPAAAPVEATTAGADAPVLRPPSDDGISWDAPEPEDGAPAPDAPATMPAAAANVVAAPAVGDVSWDLPVAPAAPAAPATPRAAAGAAAEPWDDAEPAGAPPAAGKAVPDDGAPSGSMPPPAGPRPSAGSTRAQALDADDAPSVSAPPSASGAPSDSDEPSGSMPPPVSTPPAGLTRVHNFEFKGNMLAAVDTDGTMENALGELRDLDYRYASAGRSYWWCSTSASGSALMHATRGMPDPYFFSRMLMWKAAGT